MSAMHVCCYVCASFVNRGWVIAELWQVRSSAVAWQAVGGVADASSF